MAVFAPVISPYKFDQFAVEREALRPARGAVARAPDGNHRPVDRRPLARHLGHADRAEGRPPLAPAVPVDRHPARARLRLLRRSARSCARARHGRDAGLPVPAARDRDRLPPLRQHRKGHPHRGDRDHRRVHPPLLPRHPQPDDQHPRGVVRRGGACARRAAVHRHPEVRLLQRRPERPAARDAQRGRRDPHPRRARVPRVRHPADRRRRVGLRHPACRLGCVVEHLVDGHVPRARDRAPRHRASRSSARGSTRRSTRSCRARRKVDVELPPVETAPTTDAP